MGERPPPGPAAGPPTPQRLTLSAALERAAQLQQAGRLTEAEAIYRRIVEQVPGQAEALHRLGLLAHLKGDHARAAELIREALSARPAFPEAHNNLGLVLQALQDSAAAIASHRRAVELKPDYAAGHYNLGNALALVGEWRAAAEAFRRAVALEPGLADAHANLAGVESELEEYDAALAGYRNALQLKPDSPRTLVNYANLLRRRGRLDEALAAAERAVALDPELAAAQQSKGATLVELGRHNEAVGALRRAVALDPKQPQALTALARALRRPGELEEAASAYARAIALKPDLAPAHNGLGTVRLLQGRVDEASAAYGRAIELNPGETAFLSNRLFCLNYRPGIDRATLAEAHGVWEQRHGRRLAIQARPPSNDRNPERRLRLGLVSGDLGRHPVGYFVLPLLQAHDREALEIICYSDMPVPDDLTRRLQGLAGGWRAAYGIDHRRLAEQIREDRIDLLIDLAGHTGRNRLPVFARKPAPLQLTWAGYVGTTGLSAIDYLIADRFHCPPDEPAPGPERVMRLPDGYVCYAPPDYAPPVAELPARARGAVTFASFSNLAKLNDQVLAVWAGILARLPGSRLIIQTLALQGEVGRAGLAAKCAAAGIEERRLELRGPVPHAALLKAYGEVDIALDPFPYSSGLTTCEALWMGVPTVTFPGATFAGRHSTSHLSNVGLPELVATGLEDSVERVVALAQDLDRLEDLRRTLRPRMAASPLCDGARFARGFEAAMREAWRAWCAAPAPAAGGGRPVPAESRAGAKAGDKAGAKAGAAVPDPGPFRVAVVTPYFQESLAVLRQAHDSVQAQTHPAAHILVADGHPRAEIGEWQAQHIVLPLAHGFGGNVPRAIGSISAIHQGFDAIAYLDADNWYEPDHIALMVELHRRSGAAVCVAMRNLHRSDGSLLGLDTLDSDGDRHVDTNCLFLTRAAFRLAGFWGALPRQLWPLCDALFWQAVKVQELPVALADRPTVAYRTTHARHYRMQGEPAPADTKTRALAAARQWFESLPEPDRRDLQRYLTTGAW